MKMDLQGIRRPGARRRKQETRSPTLLVSSSIIAIRSNRTFDNSD